MSDLRERVAAYLAEHPDAGRRTIVREFSVSDRAAMEALRAAKRAAPVAQQVATTPPSDIAEVWQEVIRRQERLARKRAELRATERRIILPSEPCGIAHMSDLHTGASGTDYKTMHADAVLIRDTPGLFAAFGGDGTDNWIVTKLQKLQRSQIVDFDDEWELFKDLVLMLRRKWKWILSGNHDLWSDSMAGVDRLGELVRELRVLYGRHEVFFELQHGTTMRRVKARHKWRGNSIFNPTHGLEVGWDRGDDDYDWAIGGHTHIGTLCRPFYRHGKRRYAYLIGTYKQEDEHGDAIGFPSPKGRGCGVTLLHPDGRQWWFDEVAEGAEFLAWLRQKAGV